MALINENFLKLKAGYLFPEIARRVKAFTDGNPEAAKRLIRCGIGDVTEALPEAVRYAMHEAVDELGDRKSFKGYGPEQGYDFLRNAIADNDFKARGIEVDADEIFISDGSKCDTGNILDIFGAQRRFPTFPKQPDPADEGAAVSSEEKSYLFNVVCADEETFYAFLDEQNKILRSEVAKARRSPSPAVLALVEACRSYLDAMANDGYVDFYAVRKALAAVEREIGQ